MHALDHDLGAPPEGLGRSTPPTLDFHVFADGERVHPEGRTDEARASARQSAHDPELRPMADRATLETTEEADRRPVRNERRTPVRHARPLRRGSGQSREKSHGQQREASGSKPGDAGDADSNTTEPRDPLDRRVDPGQRAEREACGQIDDERTSRTRDGTSTEHTTRPLCPTTGIPAASRRRD
jgi:hypothetical protein